MSNNNNNLKDLYNEWKSLKEEITEKEKHLKVLQEALTNRIPDNTSKAGIYHQASPGTSVSYAKVLKEVYNLVPKTKQPLIEQIKQQHTKEYYRHTFKPEDPTA